MRIVTSIPPRARGRGTEGGRGRERDGVVGVFPRSVDSAPGGNFAKMAHITASTGGKDAANMYRVGDYVSDISSRRFIPPNNKTIIPV